MAPRKRQRPNPSSSDSTATDAPPEADKTKATGPAPSTTSLSVSQSTQSERMPPSDDANKESAKDQQFAQGSSKQVRKSQSWYGSWPRVPKAAASISVARENILGGSVKSKGSADLGKFDTRKGSDSSSLYSRARADSDLSKIPEHGMSGNSDGQSGKGATTDVKVGGDDAPKPDVTMVDENKTPEQRPQPEEPTQPTTQSEPQQESQPGSQAPQSAQQPENPLVSTPQRPATESGWLGWWAKTPFTDTPTSGQPQPMEEDEPKATEPQAPKTPEQTANADNQPSNTPASASWFGFWQSVKPSTTGAEEPETSKVGGDEPPKPTEDVVMEDAPPVVAPVATPEIQPQPAPKQGSTWAFWSKDSPKAEGTPKETEAGEIAVIGEGSESHPKRMSEGDVSGTQSKPPKDAKGAAAVALSTWRKSTKRLRPPSMDIDNQQSSLSGASTPPVEPTTPKVDSKADAKVDSSSKSIAETVSAAKPNLLLPSFTSTYRMKENPSIVKQITQLFLRTQQAPANHVFRVNETPKIRKAIAIGVHGLFPSTYLRPMIGQPTGTSLRFASLCADAIRKWADDHGCGDCEIEKVALEGEGKISERVSNLWTLMLNWIDHIRSADLIIIACHSQGVPVSIMLLEKLIDLGIITNAKIGVCAMAGVALGPFPEYKSSLFGASATELWEFGNPQSPNSVKFEASLKRVLEHGARITFIGSIDDQLVPLESALYSPAHHPYIYRAVFIDGRVHAPDFIAHLVGFALKLRNLGISDHGLIRELSLPLAGSLYSGEGHSRLYYDSAVYDLAVSHALETTPAPHRSPSCVIHRREGPAVGASAAGGAGSSSANQTNPYVLPWIMRGLLEEDLVKTELSSETEELLRQFDDWKPSTKALKDVKYRLEAVRSKL